MSENICGLFLVLAPLPTQPNPFPPMEIPIYFYTFILENPSRLELPITFHGVATPTSSSVWGGYRATHSV